MPRNRLSKRQSLQQKNGSYDSRPPVIHVAGLRVGPSPSSMHALARASTIRSVPSIDDSESSRHSPLASSVNSTLSTNSAMSAAAAAAAAASSSPPRLAERSPPPVRLKADDVVSPISSSPATLAPTPVRWGARAVRASEPPPASLVREATASPPPEGLDPESSGQWDSTIGKAGLGKTGRVINKLVSDNDALKRDIQIERLRADEAKQAARLVEDKMERIISDYEGRLLEASVTKTLLTRKERQVETLTAAIDVEKKKATAALEREKNWRSELEKMRGDSTAQIDEATTYAALMEGRYKAISSHWRDQGDEVKRAMARMRSDISAIVDERRADDDKMQTLRDLCDQQDSNIRQLRRQRDDMTRLFAEYKQTQEDDLRDIRDSARAREEEQERLLEESRTALAKLRWALNVKENVAGAQ
ncbi:chromosome segregation protein SMC-like [Ophiocordyceps camponoti-floridani]|uniref:Chromosome segregation protein SMC-like n=1 Tax=Ophiocordyceps camponoti-floridani TaxID=2030778 RepID=A0A8H4QBT9_9HYPO|nr:chromosome segregation protein SMC-like [Ophiocordyceps camponoti-floridani]